MQTVRGTRSDRLRLLYLTSNDTFNALIAVYIAITSAGGHTREPGEAPAHSPCLAEVTSRGPYHRRGRCRYPPPEGAPISRAAVAAFGDEAGG
jgi:hypothetical protein